MLVAFARRSAIWDFDIALPDFSAICTTPSSLQIALVGRLNFGGYSSPLDGRLKKKTRADGVFSRVGALA
jgi:hypothetical protein